MTVEEIFEAMLKDKRVRLCIVKRSHKFFFYFYFRHYTEFEIAPFQEELFHITQDTTLTTAVVVGFRECGKSAILSMSFPLWAILGEQKIKYVLILSQTQQKAQMFLQQIKYELETNELLKRDLGPFQEERNQWNIVSLCLTHYNAKISIASTEQSIRSWRHMQYRPQLIICDDAEDLEGVNTKESRDKLYNWLLGDVIPAGSRNTRLMVTGGVLHENSLTKRLQKNIAEDKMDGIYREYPILDKSGNPTWPSKFRTPEDIEREKRKIGNELIWQREYMLQIVPEEDQVVRPEWLEGQDYDELPDSKDFCQTLISVDPAASQKESADYTAIVVISQYSYGIGRKFYVHPNPINDHLSFHETKETVKRLYFLYAKFGSVQVIVEGVVAFQYLSQELLRDGIYVKNLTVRGDKHERLRMAAAPIEAKMVYFHRQGCELIKQQLLGFGYENHDDLSDAFSLGINYLMGEDYDPYPEVIQIWPPVD